MCMSSNIPSTPPPPQDAKDPDTVLTRKIKPVGMGGNGTMLTGPTGVAPGSVNTGSNTLLGG